jgi:hypothetical protein
MKALKFSDAQKAFIRKQEPATSSRSDAFSGNLTANSSPPSCQ